MSEMSRRASIAGGFGRLAARLAVALCGGAACAAAAACAAEEDLVRWVDPLVGTVGEGNAFPGSCRPFGLVQASPDTGGRVTCSGYRHTDTTIRGFSQTHLNGTGRPAMGDLSLMPFTGDFDEANPASPFRKETQSCSPDRYAVTLDRYDIRAEATTSPRVAWWRFTFPDGEKPKLLVDAAAMLMQPFNAKFGLRIPESAYALAPDRTEIAGGKRARGWTLYRLFYSVKFDRPWTSIRRLPSDAFDGAGDRFVVEFPESDGPLTVQVALSAVSEEGARKNRAAETEGQTFETVRTANRAAWNALLSRARLVKGTEEQKASWYTALYRLCIQPNDQTDVDGRYRTADDRVATAARGHCSTFSLWDTFRAAHPLYTLLVPERVPGFVDSLLSFGRNHGHLPMWTMWENDGHDMIGVHSIPVIADAYAKGFRDFDAEEALRLMVKSMVATDGENPKNCWNAYWENGYIPYRPGEFDTALGPGGSVSRTLELAYDWWCIADFAARIGNAKTAAEARTYAGYWRNVFDEKTGFARARAPKTSGGGWREPFDPRAFRIPGAFWGDYTEANAWIYTWHVFQAPFGLAAAMGGRERALAKLDEFFATPPLKARKSANNDEGGADAEGRVKDGQVGQYWHGNEPSHHIAYFPAVLGSPAKTAELVRMICRDAYRPRPDGLCGNDDCGQMSAWYLFSMMGFYPFNPCGGDYVVGAPQAEEMRLALAGGKTLTIRAEGLSEKAKYVRAVRLNGRRVAARALSHAELLEGGELVFEMAETPCDFVPAEDVCDSEQTGRVGRACGVEQTTGKACGAEQTGRVGRAYISPCKAARRGLWAGCVEHGDTEGRRL